MSTRDDPAEVRRAQDYRDALNARDRAHSARLRALSGSRSARIGLADRWSALSPDPRYPEQAPTAPPVTQDTYAESYPPSY